MGMFDSFNMRHVMMPDLKYYDEEFQTKELDCVMHQYLVTPDGRLMKKEFDDDEDYKPCDRLIRCHLYGPINVLAQFQGGRLLTLEIVP